MRAGIGATSRNKSRQGKKSEEDRTGGESRRNESAENEQN